MASPRPPSRHRVVLRILAWVTPLAVVLAAFAGLQWLVTCIDCDGFPPPPPSVAFDAPTAIVDGFTFGVSGTSQAMSANHYRVTLRVNESVGAAVLLGSDADFIIGGETYRITWTDTDGGGLLTAGDRFRVTRAGGLLPKTDHAVPLFWGDGSIIQMARYLTP